MRFGEFEFAPALRRLERGGVRVELSSRAMDILAVLTERPGEVISKKELLARVWPHTVVVEAALRVHMVALRRKLGDVAGSGGFITTVPGRGYCFVGELEPSPFAAEDGAESAHAILRALPPCPKNVVGRAAVVENLLRQLELQRFVTVVGPGGIGKTTVALVVAHSWITMHGGAGVFVDLSELGSGGGGEGAPEALCAKLGLARRGVSSMDGAIAYFRSNPALIVLDTCEGGIEGAARLAEALVASAPGVRVLATSRESLRADGEVVNRIQPLAVPAAGLDLIAQEALKYPAVQLFVQRVTANILGFELSDQQAAVVGAICRNLDGMALAIELAAGRVEAFGIQRVADLLASEFALTWPGRRTALPRQQTLNATLNWSHELLEAPERIVFRRLSVLTGSYPLEAAIGICADDAGLTKADIVDALGSLVAKSLLSSVFDGKTHRFRMLDMTRLYALAKIAESGDERTTRLRHAEFYFDLLKRAEAEALSRPRAEWLADYAIEIVNLRVALDWAYSPAGDGSLAVALTTAAVPLWLCLSLLDECGSRARQALGVLANLAISDTRAEMTLYAALGASALDSSETASIFKKLLDIAETLSDSEYQLRALRGLYFHSHSNNQFSAALSFAQAFHKLVASRSNQSDRLVGERMLGSAKSLLGDLVGARRHLEQALVGYSVTDFGQVAVHSDDTIRFLTDGKVAVRVFLAEVLWHQGFPDQAILMAEQGLTDARAIGHVSSQCFALASGSCLLALWTGNLKAVAEHTKLLVELSLKHCLFHWANFGSRYRRVIALKGVNVDSIDGIDLSDAGFRPLTASTEIAEALAKTGRSDEGLTVLDGFESQSPELGAFTPEFLRVRGELMLLQPPPINMRQSEDLFRQALDVAHRRGALSLELRAATSLARLLSNQGRRSEATSCLRPIYDCFTEGFDTVDLITAKRLLDDLSGLGEVRSARQT